MNGIRIGFILAVTVLRLARVSGLDAICERIDFNDFSQRKIRECTGSAKEIFRLKAYADSIIFKPYRDNVLYYLSNDIVGVSCCETEETFYMHEYTEIRLIYQLVFRTMSTLTLRILDMDKMENGQPIVAQRWSSQQQTNTWSLFVGRVDREIRRAKLQIEVNMSSGADISIEYVTVFNSLVQEQFCKELDEFYSSPAIPTTTTAATTTSTTTTTARPTTTTTRATTTTTKATTTTTRATTTTTTPPTTTTSTTTTTARPTTTTTRATTTTTRATTTTTTPPTTTTSTTTTTARPTTTTTRATTTTTKATTTTASPPTTTAMTTTTARPTTTTTTRATTTTTKPTTTTTRATTTTTRPLTTTTSSTTTTPESTTSTTVRRTRTRTTTPSLTTTASTPEPSTTTPEPSAMTTVPIISSTSTTLEQPSSATMTSTSPTITENFPTTEIPISVPTGLPSVQPRSEAVWMVLTGVFITLFLLTVASGVYIYSNSRSISRTIAKEFGLDPSPKNTNHHANNHHSTPLDETIHRKLQQQLKNRLRQQHSVEGEDTTSHNSSRRSMPQGFEQSKYPRGSNVNLNRSTKLDGFRNDISELKLQNQLKKL